MRYKVNYTFENFEVAVNIAEAAVHDFNIGNYIYIEDAINDELDRVLIYYADQWEIMQHYQTPADADLYEAIEQLLAEVYDIIEEEQQGGECNV